MPDLIRHLRLAPEQEDAERESWYRVADLLYAWENLIEGREKVSVEEANSLFEELYGLWMDRERRLERYIIGGG